MMNINYKQVLPESPRPIIIIGAGGIVRDAHLPAYKKAGFLVWGIIDIIKEKADVLASKFGISHVFTDLSEAVHLAPDNVIYDVALMPEQYKKVLTQLPIGAPVLIQKPLGDNLEEATELLN